MYPDGFDGVDPGLEMPVVDVVMDGLAIKLCAAREFCDREDHIEA